MFPHMRTVFTDEELVDMGKHVSAIKKMAPTRPHPHVPNDALPRLAAYATHPQSGENFAAVSIADELLSLPMGEHLGLDDVDVVSRAVEEFFQR